MTLVTGIDQHRAQIAAEWIYTITGEISCARVTPADRAGIRKFLTRFQGESLEVALEATTGVPGQGYAHAVLDCEWREPIVSRGVRRFH